MERHVYNDGMHCEVTPAYHGWVSERFSVVWRLAELNSVPIREAFSSKLKRMYEFDRNIISETGERRGRSPRRSLAERVREALSRLDREFDALYYCCSIVACIRISSGLVYL